MISRSKHRLHTDGPCQVAMFRDKYGYSQPDEFIGCFPCRVANARLIAAAPELLKALEDIVRAIEEGTGGIGELIDAAKDVIGIATN